MQLRHLLKKVDIISEPKDTAAEVSTVCYVADRCMENSLFVAIKGLQYDGHDFIGEAIKRGAHFIVYEKDFNIPPGIEAIKVTNSRSALGIIANNYFDKPSAELVLVAVVGTSGKTTITYLLESIFNTFGFKCGVLGTVNYRYEGKSFPAANTTPESYEIQKILRDMADEGVTHVIIEVSSHALDLRRVDECDFNLGIFINLTPEHLDYHLTMENYFQAKKRFFADILPQSSKDNAHYKMIINGDDDWGQRILREVPLKFLTFGLEKHNASYAVISELSLAGIRAELSIDGENIAIETELISKFNVYNILAAATAAKALGVSANAIKEGIKKINYIPGRLEKIHSTLGFSVFVDYAHKADALQQVLQNLVQFKKSRIITVFGCGGDRDRAKRPLMGKAATSYSDLTIVTSDNPRREDPLSIISAIEAGIDKKKVSKLAKPSKNNNDAHAYMVVPDRKEAIEMAINIAQKDDIILIAGKGHEDYQIVGTIKRPFDDRVVAAEALKLRSSR